CKRKPGTAGLGLLGASRFVHRAGQRKSPHSFLNPLVASEGLSTPRASPHRFLLAGALRRIHAFHPVRRRPYRPIAEYHQRFRFRVSPPPQTAPPPILGPPDQSGPKGVSFHVATDRQEVLVLFYGKRFKPALVQMPAPSAAVLNMPALRMGQGEPSRE